MIFQLETTLFLLLASVCGVVIFRYLNLPPILGYLITGIIIGPHSFGINLDSNGVQNFAEFGVVFLMFSIGLEFSLAKLRTMQKAVFGLGLTQVLFTILITIAIVALLNKWVHITIQASIALGGTIAMSSTAIVSKMLAERFELETNHGRNIMAILLFQDLALVPLLIIVTAFGTSSTSLSKLLIFATIKIIIALSLLLIVGQKFMTSWFNIVARRKSQELFILNLLLVTLGSAYITERLGLSLALGSFIAGMLISETPYRHQVEEDIKPFRDVLLGLFFITTGMLLDPHVMIMHPILVLTFLFSLILFKAVIIISISQLFGEISSVSIRTGLGLAQAGEFGFILLDLILEKGLINRSLLQIILAGMLLSMIIAPFIIQNLNSIVLRLSSAEWMQQSLQMTDIATKSFKQSGHVIICGYGRAGQNLARMLENEGFSYVALDLDPDRVNAAATAGESVVFGNAERKESLVAAGIHRAIAISITYANTQSALRVLHYIHDLEPKLPVIVRTVDDSDIDKLLTAGATEVIPEIVEGNLMLASHTLVLIGVPMRRVLRRAEELRNQRYSLLRGYFHGANDLNNDDNEHVRLQTFSISSRSSIIGSTLKDLNLNDIGVEITAIRRKGIRGIKPDILTKLQPNDIIVLRGLPEQLIKAEEMLSQ